MAVHVSHAALPYPIKNARFSLLIPYLDADGDPTAPATPDTEFSLDNGAAADCAEEVSATSGMDGVALHTLTGAETNGSTLALNAKVASGPKATLATLYPRNLAIVGSGTLSAGSAGGGTLGTVLAYDVTGCFIRTTGGTGGGGTGGANNQARRIITYNTSSGAFTVSPNWETTPSTDTTYDVLLPEGVTLGMLQTINPATPGRKPVVDSAGLVDATAVKVGPTGSATAQTAGDIPARLPAALTSNGNMKSSVLEWISTLFTEGAAGRIAAAIQAMFNVTSPVFTVQSVNQAGDSFARIGAAGASLSGIPWNAAWDAEAQSEATDALNAYDPPTRAEATADKDEILALEINKHLTTIATLASQTSFTLTAGSADDNAYNGWLVTVKDASTATQKAGGIVSDYTGSTKTITLDADPAIFTMAVGDTILLERFPAISTEAQIASAVSANLQVKKNVAFSNFPFELFLTSGSLAAGVTPTVKIAKDGGNYATSSNSAAEKTDGGSPTGTFHINLTQTECNADVIMLKITGTGCKPTISKIVTQA